MKNVVPFLALVALVFFGCGGDSDPQVQDRSEPLTKGLFSPVQLQPDTTVINLEDYFPNGDWPDMTGVQSLGLEFRKEARELVLFADGNPIPAVSFLELGFGQHKYHVPLKRSRQVIHRFEFDPGDATYQQVQIAGNMNDWNPGSTNMELQDGKWVYDMEMDPGIYPYQLVVDGEWMLDPGNDVSVSNGMGGFNSLLTIGGSAEKIDWQMEPISGGVTVKVKGGKVLAMWENRALELQEEAGTYKVEIPAEAKSRERSHLRLFISNDSTGEVEDALVPLVRQEAVTSVENLTSADQHSDILYFILVDRFNNGDPNNDAPVDDPRVDPKANYHGGDLAGVQQKLEEGFFSDLNISTIWLSPLNQNPLGAFQEWPEPKRWFSGYHGYWPVSSSLVDQRFGSNELLGQLVDNAHNDDTKVILDFVANHVHEEHPLIKEHPDWKTQLYLEDSTLNIRIWDAQRLTTWFDTFLPSLDFSKPEVIEIQTDSALFWLETIALDGFRHDATKHIPTAFWRRLTQKIKQKVDRPIFQIGETFGSRKLIGDYVGSGMLDAQFDFNLYFDLRGVLTSDAPDANQIVQTLEASLDFYGDHHLMGNISGNHDMPRFIAYAGGDLKPSDDPKEAGWEREIGVSDPVGYEKLKQLHAFLMLAPGLPVIYYGDEIGMSGANDPDNRRDMRFDNLSPSEQAVRTIVKALTAHRSASLSTIYGRTEAFAPDKETFVMVRSYFGETSVLVLSLADEAREMEIPARLADIKGLEAKIGNASLTATGKLALPAHSFGVMVGMEGN